MTSNDVLFDTDPIAEAAGDARANADVKAGRVIGHNAVKRWLASWGSPKPLPRPQIGD
ncbi:Antitoxin RelB2 [Sphingomonas sp. EC-HK361]|uniref:CopG family transcriptional regulator n=1 Tax=Sphingomonas sp. EC-HK361 TaxID=2038397 RepID=UPI001254781B|nr:CopG family transcriptional regulator [Sphingomonas sp. EC-HK361]VVT23103.1 Antitoxin RelB2 [Sphingomonas sp. EC-HK361]